MTEQQLLEQGKRLKKFRKYFSLNQVALSRILDTTQPYLSHIERGEKGISSNLLTKIAEVYPEVNTVWLLTGNGSMLDKTINQATIEGRQVKDQVLPNSDYLSIENDYLTDNLQAAEPETNYERAQIQIHHLLRRINELEQFISKKFPDFKPRR